MTNKYALSDQIWQKTEEGYEVRSVFKMTPATRVFNPGHRYRFWLEDGTGYMGLFIHYIYKKETFDSPLVRVYIQFKLEENVATGMITVPEDKIVTYGEIK